MKKRMSMAQKYRLFVAENHTQGSGMAQSCVTAINKLERALHNSQMLPPQDSLWNITDTEYLANLYEIVKREQRKADGGIFRDEQAPSYWQRGFCSAALKQLSQFLTLYAREEIMRREIATATDGTQLGKSLASTPLRANPLLISDDIDISSDEGKTALREVEVRQNQYVFRKMVLGIYQCRCCLTGLPIPEVLRASHISEWAKDKDNRLNPENGLCLSATYDAAFDRHLISFDDDYRMILAPSLRDYYQNNVFQEQFKHFEGKRIALPVRFLPSKDLLAKHREAMR